MKKGMLVIISSPSGGGKDSVVNIITKKIPNSRHFVTTTTRAPREGEIPGKNYFFISLEDFRNKIKRGAFLEYNFYAGNYYGTEREVLEDTLANYDIVISQIEVHGKHNLDKLKIENLSIFLMPQSMDIIRNRLVNRGGLPEKDIQERMEIALNEIEESKDYDYQVVNKEGGLDETVAKVEEIIKKELTKRQALDKSDSFS